MRRREAASTTRIRVGFSALSLRRVAALCAEHGVHSVNLRPSLTGLCPSPLQRTTVGLFAEAVIPHLRNIPDGTRRWQEDRRELHAWRSSR